MVVDISAWDKHDVLKVEPTVNLSIDRQKVNSLYDNWH